MKGNKENKNNGIKTVLTVIIALIMTSTIFVPIMGVRERRH